MEKLKEKKVVELKAMAKSAGIKGYSKMRKDQLIKAILNISENKVILPKPEKSSKTKIPESATSTKVEVKCQETFSQIPAFEQISPCSDEFLSKKLDTGQNIAKTLKEEKLDIPESYGKDRLILLPKDPKFLFCYWELSEATIQRTTKNFDNPEPVLKIKISDSKELKKNIDFRWKKYYVEAHEKGVPYYAELGFKTRDGVFHLILKSNVVFTPTDSISSNVNEIFVTIPFDTPLSELKGNQMFYMSPSGKLLSEGEYRKLFDKGLAPSSYKNYSKKI